MRSFGHSDQALYGESLVSQQSAWPKTQVLLGDATSFVGAERIAAIARGDYRGKTEEEIRGSGYVVESLEAALWAFSRTDSFADAVLLAANLGDDADTTAAVCGQIAGAFYGEPGIPAHWLERLTMRDEIAELADRIHGRPFTPRVLPAPDTSHDTNPRNLENKPMPAANGQLNCLHSRGFSSIAEVSSRMHPLSAVRGPLRTRDRSQQHLGALAYRAF